MMKREPVAFDFVDLSGRATADDRSATTHVRRPIPSVPDDRLGMSKMKSPPDQGFRNHSESSSDKSSYFLRPGLRQQPWNRLPVAARFQSDEDSSGKVAVSPKRERESTDGPLLGHHLSLSARENSAPASSSHHNHHDGSAWGYEEFVRMQQSRKTAAMNARGQQASRRVHYAGAQTSPFRDDAQRGAQPSDRTGLERFVTQPHLPANQRGFRSPAPFYGRMRPTSAENGAAMADMRPPFQQHPFQAGNSPRPDETGKQPRTAQLTIFYASMVNVYDDVPFDKAQAIMLLAGSGNRWPLNDMSLPGSGAPQRSFSAPTAVPQPTPSTSGSPAPQDPTISAAGPQRPMAPGVVFSNVRQPALTNVELPQARKASLARFLEKRKDRVRKVPVKLEGEASPSRDKSPSPSIGKPSTRSPSPAPAVHDRGSSPGGLRHQPGASSCNEPNSPTRPPQTPPRQSVSEEKSAGTPKRRPYYEIQQESNKRARSGRSPSQVAGGSTTDAMEGDSTLR